ncbi:hypothetical protein TNCV_3377581 [Trichonephila clavipes]|nr:hypothetical protein TNCV_3377581 [Trichonephila clavipes]
MPPTQSGYDHRLETERVRVRIPSIADGNYVGVSKGRHRYILFLYIVTILIEVFVLSEHQTIETSIVEIGVKVLQPRQEGLLNLSIDSKMLTSQVFQYNTKRWKSRDARSVAYTRAFGDGPRIFEPWSSDVDDIIFSPNYRTTPTGTFQLSTDLTCIAALHGGSLVVLGFVTRQATIRYHTTRLPRPPYFYGRQP